MRRRRTECNGCLYTIYTLNEESSRCPLCACYVDYVYTPDEARALAITDMKIPKRKVDDFIASWRKYFAPDYQANKY